MQEANLLLQLDKKDKNGNAIKYNLVTYEGNKRLIHLMEKSGIIQNYADEKIEDKKVNMKRVEISMGNFSSSRSKQKKKKRDEEVEKEEGFFNKLKKEINYGEKIIIKMYTMFHLNVQIKK